MADRSAALVAFAIGLSSVGCLVTACIYMVQETTLALNNLKEEARTVKMETARRNVEK